MKPPRPGLIPPHPTHYQRLGLPEDATVIQIDAAWRLIAPTLPPIEPMAPSLVTPGTTETDVLRAAAIRLAYQVLSHPARRAVYDRWLAAQRAGEAGWWQRLKRRFAT